MRRAFIALLSAGLATTAAAEQLFDPARYRSLVSDHRAHQLGDNLTITIAESAVVSTSASTRTNKDGSIGATISRPLSDKRYRLGLDEDFDGGGTISRTGRLAAQLTVSVLALEPNGDLRVGGEQEIEVNNEKQRIAIQGRVRPQDIDATNSVPSTRVSFSKIEFVGQGLLSEKERQGWLTRVLSWLRIL